MGASIAMAQAPIDLEKQSQDQERRAQEALDARQKKDIPPDVRLQSDRPKAYGKLLPLEAPCFVIDLVTLQSFNSEKWQWLVDQADGRLMLEKPEPIQGRCIGAQGAQIIIDRIQHALIAKGYVTSRVLATPQNLQSGQLSLQIHEGTVEGIVWQTGSGQRASRWNTMPISQGQVLNLRDIEQALENFKRVPTADASIDIEPAKEPGYSTLVVRHQQPFPFRISASVDDSGNRSTGKYQGSVTLSYDNWWNLSDLFYVTWQSELGGKDQGPRGTQGRTSHYSVPWGYNLLSLTHSLNNYHQTVAGANADILYKGESENAEVKISRVIQRDSIGKTTAGLKGFVRRSKNFIDDEEVEVQRRAVSGIEWELGHRRAIGRGTFDAQLNYRVGTGAWGSTPAPEESFGEGTSRMRLWLAEANLQWPFQVAQKTLTLNSTWKGQSNKTPLTPQDRFSIGGRYTVRGYDGLSVLSAERGWLWRNDVSMPASSGTQIYAGVDYGQVAGPSAQNLVGNKLSGLVLGWKGQYKKMQFDAFVGRPLETPTHFKTSPETAGFSISVSY